jgi:hypothetical protein
MHLVGASVEMIKKFIIELKLISATVDYCRRVSATDLDNILPFHKCGVGGALYVHKDSKLVRRLHIFLRRYYGVETNIVKAKLLELFNYVTVKSLVVRRLYAYGVVTMLANSAEIIRLAV